MKNDSPAPANADYPHHRNHRMAVKLILATGILLVLGCAAAPKTTTPSTPSTSSSSSAKSSTATVATKAIPPVPTIKDGTWNVPTDVRPGTYRTTVPTDSFGCYWERLKGFTGQLEDIIANDTIEAGKTGIVTIKATDKGFHAMGCGTWTKQ